MSILKMFSLADRLFGSVDNAITGYFNKEITEEEVRRDIEQAKLDFRSSLAEQQAGVIKAEINADSWLTRNWRPVTMLVFLWDIQWYVWTQPALAKWVGMPSFEPAFIGPEALVDLLTLGLTGYVVGRSGEKMVTNWRQGRALAEGVVSASLTSDAVEKTVERAPARSGRDSSVKGQR